MENKSLRYRNTVLFVKDIKTAKTFYTDVLHQEIDFDFDKTIGFKSGVALWQISNDHPAITSGNHQQSSGFELYLETGNLDSDREKLMNTGIKLLHDVIEESWGQRTFRFYDPDGHLIELGESLPTFINRMAQTMSIEEIHQKTSVPVGDIHKLIKQ
ncbi:MAG: VOC family protein [Bacteroidales bacterium]